MPQIKKILRVENIGRFLNGIQKGPEFKQYNLFLQRMGVEKQLFAQCSIQTGEHEHIPERKTVGLSSGDPVAEIRLDWPDRILLISTFCSANSRQR